MSRVNRHSGQKTLISLATTAKCASGNELFALVGAILPSETAIFKSNIASARA
jgi:hypothetical protein